MTFGDDPFGLDKEKDRKSMKALTFFIIYLIMWYIFSHHFF